jgi:hypothetical protein
MIDALIKRVSVTYQCYEMYVVVSNNNTDGNQQYVIQYVTPQDTTFDDTNMVEVQTIPGHTLQEIEIEPSTLDVNRTRINRQDLTII